jgi:hypothetical protein
MSEEKKKSKTKWIWITFSLITLIVIYLFIELVLWLNSLVNGVGDAASGVAEFIFPLRKD